MGSLLMHASIPITQVSSFLWDFCTFPFLFSLFTLLSFLFFYLSFLGRCSLPPPPSPLLFMYMTFYTTCHDKIYNFYHLTAFGALWASFQDCPLVCQLPSHYHYTVLVAQRLIPKQKWFLFCLLPPFIFNTLIWIRVKPLPDLHLWHASSDSSSCLLLLDEMSSQQDISP